MAGSSLAPNLLVAMPQLVDPNFRRTVVLLIHHDADGTFGIVLNRHTEVRASDLCGSLGISWNGDADEGVDWGGPVQPQTGWVLFDPEDAGRLGAEEIKQVAERICFAGSLDVLRAIAQDPPDKLRVLLGYAGWGPGQLEAELSEGAWLLAPASSETVFDVDLESMWECVVRGLGIEPATLVATRGIH